MSAIIKTSLHQIDVQLENGKATTPARVRFDQDGITVEIDTANTLLSFEFLLVDHIGIDLIERRMNAAGVDMKVREIHNFADDDKKQP